MSPHVVALAFAVGLLCMALSFALNHAPTKGAMMILAVLAFAVAVALTVYEIVA